MTTKNYKLDGVGADLEFGKRGLHLKHDGAKFSITDTGNSLVRLKGAPSVDNDDFVTRAELTGSAAGIHVLTGALVSTVAEVSASGATFTPGSGPQAGATTDTWTNVPDSVIDTGEDGNPVTLVVGNRVLIRGEGIDFTDPTNPTLTANASRNGLYTVTAVGPGTYDLKRSTDTDNISNTDETAGVDELKWGSYIYVSSGDSFGGTGYILSKSSSDYAGVGLGPELYGTPDNQAWVKFLAGQQLNEAANGGLKVEGNSVELDYTNLPNRGTTDKANDVISMMDSASGTHYEMNFGTLLAQSDIVETSTITSGIIVKLADDSYAGRSVVSGPLGGLSIVNGDGVAGDVTVDLDIAGLNDFVTGVDVFDGTERLAIFDGSTNRDMTVNEFLAEYNVPGAVTGTGFVYNDGTGTYSTGQISSSVTGGHEGIIVNNGSTANPSVGLDISGLADGTGDLTVDDLLIFKDITTGANMSTSVQAIADIVAESASADNISSDDSSITIIDDGVGAGSAVVVIDGNTVATFTTTGATMDALNLENLEGNKVIFSDASNNVVTTTAFTFDGTNLSVGGGSITGGAINGSSAVISGQTSTGSLSSGDATFTGTFGAINGTFSGALQAGSFIDDSLTVGGGVVFATGGDLSQDDGTTSGGTSFVYDPTTGTLTVENLTVAGTLDAGGIGGIAATQVAYGSADGGMTSEADFTYDDVNNTLSIGSVQVNGDTDTITTQTTDGDLILAPNGTGNVIIQGSGNAEIVTEAGESLALRGDGITLTKVDGTEYLTFTDDFGTFYGSKDNNLAIGGAASGAQPQIVADGSDTNVGLEIVVKGDGLVAVSDAATYKAALDASANGGALVTKDFVADSIQNATVPGTQGSVFERVSLAANGSVTLMAEADKPATGMVATRITIRYTSGTTTQAPEVTITDNGVAIMAAEDSDSNIGGVYTVDAFAVASVTGDLAVTVANSDGSGEMIAVVEYLVGVPSASPATPA